MFEIIVINFILLLLLLLLLLSVVYCILFAEKLHVTFKNGISFLILLYFVCNF